MTSQLDRKSCRRPKSTISFPKPNSDLLIIFRSYKVSNAILIDIGDEHPIYKSVRNLRLSGRGKSSSPHRSAYSRADTAINSETHLESNATTPGAVEKLRTVEGRRSSDAEVLLTELLRLLIECITLRCRVAAISSLRRQLTNSCHNSGEALECSVSDSEETDAIVGVTNPLGEDPTSHGEVGSHGETGSVI